MDRLSELSSNFLLATGANPPLSMKTKVLVVGGGGREHAIVEALLRDGAAVYSAMRNQNPGIARAAVEIKLVKETDVSKVVEFALIHRRRAGRHRPRGTFGGGIGGFADKQGHRLRRSSPGRGPPGDVQTLLPASAQEAPHPGERGVRNISRISSPAEAFVNDFPNELVVKPEGLTGGKGVKVEGEHLNGKKEVLDYVREILDHKIGGAGVVLEERLVGEEFTLQAFCDGRTVRGMPLVQDHKRAYDGDVGPNTGGMGSYTDADHLLPFVTGEKDREAAEDIVQRTVAAMREEGCPIEACSTASSCSPGTDRRSSSSTPASGTRRR